MMKDLTERHLVEYMVSSQTIASGGMLTVKRDKVRLPSGNLSQREYVVHPGAVAVVPILPNGNVILEKQFRYPLNQVFIELPAGKIDANEEILVTGQRELLEETGYSATEWTLLGHQHPCIGYSNEIIHMYMARGLTQGAHQRDADETLVIFDLPFEQCLNIIQTGQITDGKTIVALYSAEKYLQSVNSSHG